MNYKKACQALLARMSIGDGPACVICGHRVGRFLPYQGGWKQAPALMHVLEVVGSDLDHFECPWCGSHDRERHLLLYMQASGVLERVPGQDVLHFAPEGRLCGVIEAAEPRCYRKADLVPQAADVERMDLLAIPCDGQTFDLVIANHVLEHVIDDLQAIREIHRVLRPGGHAILQTPYSVKLLHTWSDSGIDTDYARLQAYGQEDHVRLFGRDIFQRIASAGLIACGGSHEVLLRDWDATKYGVNHREPFFLFRRPVED